MSGRIIESATGVRMTVLVSENDNEGKLNRSELYLPVGAKVPEHFHPDRDQRLEIVSGDVVISLDGKTQVFKPGDVVEVQAGARHAQWVEGSEPVVMIEEFRPGHDVEAFFVPLFRCWGQGGLELIKMAVVYRRMRHVQRPGPLMARGLFAVLGAVGEVFGIEP